jgi:hypothetical protein
MPPPVALLADNVRARNRQNLFRTRPAPPASVAPPFDAPGRGEPTSPVRLPRHNIVFRLLPAKEELGMDATAGGQLVPDQSTAALVIHHPEAIDFSAFGQP